MYNLKLCNVEAVLSLTIMLLRGMHCYLFFLEIYSTYQ